MIVLDINSDELVGFANKLEKLHKSAFPSAIKGTLNGTGMIMKKETMPKKAKEMFEERQPNFFKANSRVDFASGFDIKTMVSTVGFVSSGLHNSATNYAVKDLEEQEHGGTIDGKSFKPLADARKSITGTVKANARISKLRENLILARNSKAANKMQQLIKAAAFAGKGGNVLATNGNKGGYLFKVKSLKRVGKNTRFEMQKLYSFTKSGTAKVTATGFMRAAALEAQKEMEGLFKREAERQIRRYLK